MFRSKFLLIFLLMVTLSSVLPASESILKQGRALQRERKFDEALQLYKNGLKQNPTEDLYVEAGALLGKMQKYENAETVLEKGLQDFAESKSLRNLLALIKIRKGDKAKAKALLEEVLAKDPENGFAKKWLAKVDAGDVDDADQETAVSQDVKPAQVSSGSSITGTVSTGAYRVDSSLSKDEQKALAVKLYQEMMDLEKWELDSFKELHRKVIEKCPLTDQAEESCWRLSNLYLLGEDPPDFQNVIEVLEHLLKQYPNTPLMPDAKNRLLVSYQQSGQMDKVVTLYEELFTLDPDPIDEKVFMVRALEFADALSAVGRTSDAQLWYQKIIERDDGKDSLEARVARERLSAGQ